MWLKQVKAAIMLSVVKTIGDSFSACFFTTSHHVQGSDDVGVVHGREHLHFLGASVVSVNGGRSTLASIPINDPVDGAGWLGKISISELLSVVAPALKHD